MKKLLKKILNKIVEVEVSNLFAILLYIGLTIISLIFEHYVTFALLTFFGTLLVIICIAVAIQDHLEFQKDLKKRGLK